MKIKKWEYITGGIILAIALFFAFYAVVKFHFASPPGDDIYPHLHNVYLITRKGIPSFMSSYPPGFYFIVLAVGKLFNLSILQALTYIAPVLIPLSGISLWLLARRLFNPTSALITLALFELVSLQPLQTYFDGTLPNLFTAGILLPLFFLAIICWVEGKRRVLSMISAGVLLAAILYSHHLTALILLATLLIWGMVSGLILLIRTRSWQKITGGLAFIIISLAALVLAFAKLEIFYQARELFLYIVHISSTFPYLSSAMLVSKSAWDSHLFGVSTGGLVFQAGVVGFFLVLGQGYKFRKPSDFTRLLVAVWFFIYWVGAFHQWSGEPTRLARDLSLPAVILGGWFIYWLFTFLYQHYRLLAYVFAGLSVLVSIGGVYTRIQYETANTAMVRFSVADEQAYRYLLDNHYASETIVLDKEVAWTEVARSRGDLRKFVGIIPEKAFGLVNPPSFCYLVGWYEAGVWPSTHADRTVAETYLHSDLQEVQHFQDDTKEWYLLCKSK